MPTSQLARRSPSGSLDLGALGLRDGRKWDRRKDNHAGGAAHDLRRLPGTVKASLQRVPGVTNVVVSAEDKTAVVTYDDSKAQVDALVKATTNAGYPSTPKG